MVVEYCLFFLLVGLNIILIPVYSLDLEEALLFDMFPPPSEACINNSDNPETSYTFNHSPSQSYWDPMAQPYEDQIFLAEMSSVNDDENRTWVMRIGQSGNMYSFRGAYGEAIPPQYHTNAPFIDEVNQIVAFDEFSHSSTYPYYIHQSGTYMRDSPYTDNPFFSPSIAKICKDRTCVFASWGQQAHVPTIHKGVALYYTMYSDCGNGVIEFSEIIHHMANNNGDELTYLNMPWSGMRKSTLRSYVQSKSDGTIEHQWPITHFDNYAENTNNLNTLGGFTIFAENLLLSGEQCVYELPVVGNEAIRLVVANVANNKHTIHSSFHTSSNGAHTARTQIEPVGGSVGEGCESYLWFTNSRTGEKIVTRVLHWAWLGKYIYHFPVDLLAYQINSVFSAGDEILVSCANDGLAAEDNLALTHAYGYQSPGMDSRTQPTRVRYGAVTTPGRDYTVHTVNPRVSIESGETYLYRQYFITGKYETAQEEGSKWEKEAYDEFYFPGELIGRTIELYSIDEDSFAVAVSPDSCYQGELRCSGQTVPGFGLVPHFFITCGDNTYMGPDQYHFAPDPTSDNIIRAYACDGELSNVRPTLKLMGYFTSGSCSYLQSAKMIDDSEIFCTDISSAVPSMSPTSHPSKTPSVSPSVMPSNHPSDKPSYIPSITPSAVPSKILSSAPSDTPSSPPSITLSTTPSSIPSNIPSDIPSDTPTGNPSDTPSSPPSITLSTTPSNIPSDTPTSNPSDTPSYLPSITSSTTPSNTPSDTPTSNPSETPSFPPSITLSTTPSNIPSNTPTSNPSDTLSSPPSITLSTTPSNTPTSNPSETPSYLPSITPFAAPSNIPSNLFSSMPSSGPTIVLSSFPSEEPIPTALPSQIPTDIPTETPKFGFNPTPSGVLVEDVSHEVDIQLPTISNLTSDSQNALVTTILILLDDDAARNSINVNNAGISVDIIEVSCFFDCQVTFEISKEVLCYGPCDTALLDDTENEFSIFISNSLEESLESGEFLETLKEVSSTLGVDTFENLPVIVMVTFLDNPDDIFQDTLPPSMSQTKSNTPTLGLPESDTNTQGDDSLYCLLRSLILP